MRTEVMSDYIGIAAQALPLLRDNLSVTTDWVDMAKWQRVMFIVQVGATDITVNAKLQSADDAAGTNPLDIPGKATSQWGATDDNKIKILNVSKDELNEGDVAVACIVTIADGTLGANVSVVALGIPHFVPPEYVDLAAVAQIVE